MCLRQQQLTQLWTRDLGTISTLETCAANMLPRHITVEAVSAGRKLTHVFVFLRDPEPVDRSEG